MSRHAQRPTPHGFSLLELMLVLAIFAIISAAIFMTMASGQVSWQMNEATVQVQENLRRALGTLGQELRESGRENTTEHVLIDGAGDVLVFQVPVDADPGTPEFDLDAGGNIVWGAEGTVGNALRYDVQGTQLIRQEVDSLGLGAAAVGAARVVANNITDVAFDRVPLGGTDDMEGVDIALEAEKASLSQKGGTDHMLTLTQRLHIILRNVSDD